jgi:Spy/CpxP family protein refolding chaperone
MRTMKYFLMATMTLGLAAGLGVFGAADDAKPKYDTEEIMQKAHKAPKGKLSLFQQVAKGKANEEQQKQLLDYYQELAKNKPEKGDPKDWQRRTNALVKAAKDVIDGKAGASQRLAKAADCKGCHQLHRGE